MNLKETPTLNLCLAFPMEKFLKVVGYLDYAGGAASLVWGVTHQSLLWGLFGVAGLAFAWYSPARRVNAYVKRRVIAKRSSRVPDDDPIVFAASSTVASDPLSLPTSSVPYYGVREGLPYPQGFCVCRFEGLDSFLRYALYVGNRFALTNR
jgi:hypothetical protein